MRCFLIFGEPALACLFWIFNCLWIRRRSHRLYWPCMCQTSCLVLLKAIKDSGKANGAE